MSYLTIRNTEMSAASSSTSLFRMSVDLPHSMLHATTVAYRANCGWKRLHELSQAHLNGSRRIHLAHRCPSIGSGRDQRRSASINRKLVPDVPNPVVTHPLATLLQPAAAVASTIIIVERNENISVGARCTRRRREKRYYHDRTNKGRLRVQ